MAGVVPRGVRTDLMTGDYDNGLTQHESKDVPQFVPNFTVYVLPPDVVCLYSEHRKFFLHGELYCALASAIGAGTSFRELVRELEQDFPSDKIHEALKRLVDRRFIFPTPRSSVGTTDAYWASLGLPPEAAERNLQKFRVRIQSIDVQGAMELSAALSGLDVRVVKRPADLTVTLVSDYLEGRLAELNRQHLSETNAMDARSAIRYISLGRTIVQPRQERLLDLSRRPDQAEPRDQGVPRPQTGSLHLAVSSPPRPIWTECHSARGAEIAKAIATEFVQLAAVEIAKAIATDFRTDLRDHVISFDLLGSSIVRHYVATRPQCPTCGRLDLRDPSRAPVPIKIDVGGKLLMTSGGYRAVSPSATVARFRKHVSPLTGVVSQLERIAADLPMNTNYLATHNFSSHPETVEELKAGLSGGSYGKGSTAEQGEASALMEAIERYSGIFQGDEIRVTRRFTDFSPGDAILPNDVLLFSDAQLQGDQPDAAAPHDALAPQIQLDRSAQIEWSPIWSLRDERFKYLPTSILYFSYPAIDQHSADSNGCAAGNTLEEAIVQGFLELVEREFIRDLVVQSTTAGRSGPQSVRQFLHPRSTESNLPKLDAAFGCSTSPAISGFRALWR